MKKVLTKRLTLAILLPIATIFTITSISAQVSADGCTYTGNSRGYCAHGGYLVQNCLPGDTDCGYDVTK